MDEFSSHFEQEFSLVVVPSSSVTPSTVWYIDSGTSPHMTDVGRQFSKLTKMTLDIEVC